jgi:hypothetical protein
MCDGEKSAAGHVLVVYKVWIQRLKRIYTQVESSRGWCGGTSQKGNREMARKFKINK